MTAPRPIDALLPLVYDELRRLAARHLAGEPVGHTLDATALVHEAYLRLAGRADLADPAARARFFSAAAEAMRRILVDHARSRRALKRGGPNARVDLPDVAAAPPALDPSTLLALDEALTRLAERSPDSARLVELRHFAGLPMDRVAEVLGVSLATAERRWTYARAFLKVALDAGQGGD
jgi:RNA polymerase sigma factor (TIGR02999 family)